VAQYRGLRPPGAKRHDRVVLTKCSPNQWNNSIKRKRKSLYQFFYYIFVRTFNSIILLGPAWYIILSILITYLFLVSFKCSPKHENKFYKKKMKTIIPILLLHLSWEHYRILFNGVTPGFHVGGFAPRARSDMTEWSLQIVSMKCSPNHQNKFYKIKEKIITIILLLDHGWEYYRILFNGVTPGTMYLIYG
jgi:hypothetical protein